MDLTAIYIIGKVLFLVICLFFFYKLGWHKRNLVKNSHLQKQAEYYKELHLQERELRRKTIFRTYLTIKNMLEESNRLNLILKQKDDKIDSLEESVKSKNKVLKTRESLPKSNQFKKARLLVEESPCTKYKNMTHDRRS